MTKAVAWSLVGKSTVERYALRWFCWASGCLRCQWQAKTGRRALIGRGEKYGISDPHFEAQLVEMYRGFVRKFEGLLFGSPTVGLW